MSHLWFHRSPCVPIARRVPDARPPIVLGGLLLVLLLILVCGPRSAEADVLSECVALSAADNDVHACLDNYLDATDERIERVSREVRQLLGEQAQAYFERAQTSFRAYRRDNCLWYLAFNTPRTEAEKIAKNCLARHSIQRLVELQGLLAVNNTALILFDGHYVFDATRNSFQPCGSDRQFWIDGDDAAIAYLQQQYLERSVADGQRMFARVEGVLEKRDDARPGHAGRLRLDAVQALREPAESDCRLTGVVPSIEAATAPAAVTAEDSTPEPPPEPPPETPLEALPEAPLPDVATTPATNPVADPDAPGESRRPPGEQRLTAYFGAWLADCDARTSRAACRLSVDFFGGNPGLTLERNAGERTRIMVALPPAAATNAEQVTWAVDDESLGAIDGVEWREDAAGVELALSDQRFIDDRLMPMLRAGDVLRVGTSDDAKPHEATLIGLSRALAFADDFINGVQ